MSPMRRDEELSKDRFDAYLRSKVPSAQIMWTEGNQNEPPDFYLNINSDKFAVEITNLVEMIHIPSETSKEKPVPLQSVADVVKKIVKAVQQKTKVQGTYAVYFPIHQDADFYGIKAKNKDRAKTARAVQHAIIEQISSYISQTQLQEEVKYIYFEYRLYCTIQKLSSSGSEIGLYYSPPISNPHDMAPILLANSIKRKYNTIGSVNTQKILIITDQYFNADAPIYLEAVKNIPEVVFFHTVFLIMPFASDIVLHTNDPDWA